MLMLSLPFHVVAGCNDHRGARAQYHSRIKPEREGATKALNDILQREEPEFIKRHKIPVVLRKGRGKTRSVYAIHQLVKPVVVKLTRVYGPGKRKLDGHDNLQSSLKPCVDGLTIALGLKSDDHDLVKWEHFQRSGPESSVEIQIWPREDCAIGWSEVSEFVAKIYANDNGARFVGGRLQVLHMGRLIDVKVG